MNRKNRARARLAGAIGLLVATGSSGAWGPSGAAPPAGVCLHHAPTTEPAGAPDRPRLGVKVLPTPSERGVMLSEVTPGFSADRAGLRVGDCVTRIDDAVVDGVDAFRSVVERLEVGQSACFTVERDSAVVLAWVTLAPPGPDAPGARPPTHPDLRDELLTMGARDQAIRRQIANAPTADRTRLHEEMAAVDAANTAALRAMVERHGFPTVSMVGEEAADAAFLVAQHADADLAFQKRVLRELEALAERGEASRSSVAYLTDRILRAEQKPQLYGTQYHQEADGDGVVRFVPPVVVNPSDLDRRRRAMGLEPWAQYEQAMARLQRRAPFDGPRAAE